MLKIGGTVVKGGGDVDGDEKTRERTAKPDSLKGAGERLFTIELMARELSVMREQFRQAKNGRAKD